MIAYEHAVYEALHDVSAPGEDAAPMVRARQVSGRGDEVGRVVDLPGGGNGRPHSVVEASFDDEAFRNFAHAMGDEAGGDD